MFRLEATNVIIDLNGKNIAFAIYQDVRSRFSTCVPCYEPDVVHVMTRFIRPGDCVVDAGANFGYYTLLMSKLVGKDGVVVSVEPDKFSIQVLDKNIKINQFENVLVCDKALWDEVGEKEFTCLKEAGGSSSFVQFQVEGAVTIKKQTTRLDDLIALPVRLVKLDCEGAEYNILKGARRLLEEGIDAIIVELNFLVMPHFGWTVRTLRDYMKGLGYDFFLLNVNGLFPTLIPHEVEFNFSSCVLNVLFSKLETVAQNWPTVNITSVGPIFLGTYITKDGSLFRLGQPGQP